MFSFASKQQAEEVKVETNELPEECELLTDCDFAEVSGGSVAMSVAAL